MTEIFYYLTLTLLGMVVILLAVDPISLLRHKESDNSPVFNIQLGQLESDLQAIVGKNASTTPFTTDDVAHLCNLKVQLIDIIEHSRHPRVLRNAYDAACALEACNRHHDAVEIYSSILAEYDASPWCLLAKERLKELQTQSPDNAVSFV